MAKRNLRLRAAQTQTDCQEGNCEIVEPVDTIGDAKLRIKHLFSKEYHKGSEASSPLLFAEILEDEVVTHQLFANGYHGRSIIESTGEVAVR